MAPDQLGAPGSPPKPGQTHLTYTEQGVHFGGLDSPEGREEGTRGLLGQLGCYLSPGRP
jgi:hypothetical protein